MRNLLSAHFARLWKSRLFWMCAVISLAYGAFPLNSWYRYSQILTRLTARQTLSMPLYSCAVAVFSTAAGLLQFQRKDIK